MILRVEGGWDNRLLGRGLDLVLLRLGDTTLKGKGEGETVGSGD